MNKPPPRGVEAWADVSGEQDTLVYGWYNWTENMIPGEKSPQLAFSKRLIALGGYNLGDRAVIGNTLRMPSARLLISGRNNVQEKMTSPRRPH